jgi:hypothetical protein
MKAAHAPKIQDRHLWNAYRDKVIEAVVAVELQMKQAGRSLDVEGLTCEVAPLLGQVIEDMADYNVLSLYGPCAPLLTKPCARPVRNTVGSFRCSYDKLSGCLLPLLFTS